MIVKMFVGDKPVDYIYFGNTPLSKLSLGESLFSEYNFVNNLEYANIKLYVSAYKRT